MRKARSGLGALAVAGFLAVPAACAGTGSQEPAAPPTTAPAAAALTTPPPAPSPVTTPARPSDPAGRPASGGELPRCATRGLTASLGESEGAAGSVYRALVFTNTGSTECELRGFPGVSYVAGEDGHQVGPAAEMSGERGGQVPIAPGGTARAQLQLVNVQNFDPASCAPTAVRGLRVYPPGDTESLFVPVEGSGCTATPPGPQLAVQTITP
jgi:hypothetical protein